MIGHLLSRHSTASRFEGGKIVTKWWEGQLIMWGADWYGAVPELPESPLTELAQMEAATDGVEFDEWFWSRNERSGHGSLRWGKGMIWIGILVQKMDGGPVEMAQYQGATKTAVDVNTGEILWRQNRVVSH